MNLQFTTADIELTYDRKAKFAFLMFIAILFLAFIYLGISLGSSALQKKKELGRVQQLIENAGRAANTYEDSNIMKLFKGSTLAEIQSKLQERVKQIGDRYAIAIDSIQALDPTKQGDLMVSQIRLNGSIPEEYFPSFITELAKASPAVFLSDVDLRAARVRTARVSDLDNQAPKLSVQLVLSGLSLYNPDFNLR